MHSGESRRLAKWVVTTCKLSSQAIPLDQVQRVLGSDGSRFDLEGNRGLPYDLREGIALNGSSFFVLERIWSTDGAQEFPFGVVVVSNETLSQKLNESSIMYIGGPVGGQLTLFWTMP